MNAGQDVRGSSSVTDLSVYNILGTVLQLISDSGLDSHLNHTGTALLVSLQLPSFMQGSAPLNNSVPIVSWYFSPLLSRLHVKGVNLRTEDELFVQLMLHLQLGRASLLPDRSSQ